MLRLENTSRPHSVRRGALEKLAELSAAGSGQSDLARLCQRCPKLSAPPITANGSAVNGGAAGIPMKLPELEVLLALCKAAPYVESGPTAEKLFHQLSPYVAESYTQAISNFSSLRYIDPSPWESLTCNLVSALLALGLRHESLRADVAAVIRRYVEGWAHMVRGLDSDQLDGEDYADYSSAGAGAASPLSRVLTSTLSVLGFLDAATRHARFWSAQERIWLADTLRDALSDKFTVALEAALSVVRNARSGQRGLKAWKKCAKHYAALGRPLGAMLLHEGFTQFLVAGAALLTAPSDRPLEVPILDYLQENHPGQGYTTDTPDDVLANGLVSIATDKMESLRNDLDYLQQVGSAWQQRLAARVKANIFVTFLCCAVFNSEVAEADRLLEWLEATLSDPVQIADEDLAAVVLKCMPVLARVSSDIASSLSRSLPKFIVQSGLDSRTASLAAGCLASILHLLPQDAIITTLYSLGNVLSGGKSASEQQRGSVSSATVGNGSLRPHRAALAEGGNATGSSTSLSPSEAAAVEEVSDVYFIVIEAVVGIAVSCEDSKITALALSMLIQKLGKVGQTVDAKIITETARLGRYADPGELRGLLKVLNKLCHDALVNDNQLALFAVMNARLSVAREIGAAFAASHAAADPSSSAPATLAPSAELFEVLLTSFLETIVSKGDAHDSDNRTRLGDHELAAQEIAQLLAPLATLVAATAAARQQALSDTDPYEPGDTVVALQRNAWFNVVVHGFNIMSPLGRKYAKELKTLALYSKPLIAEERADMLESDIELNTVLRRGKNSPRADEHKANLTRLLPGCEPDVRGLSYSEAVFLNAVYLVEDLRSATGNCSRVLAYFREPKIRAGDMGNCMIAIARAVVGTYLTRTLSGKFVHYSAPYLAQQLAVILAGCCHRVLRVQQAATACADLIIQEAPSTLCQKTALFALLELLSLMWGSCLEGETDEYEWKATHHSPHVPGVSVELSDNYEFRRATLLNFQQRARAWVLRALDLAPLDVKGLLQTYLAECAGDDAAYGHLSLGRSFALEMGSAIPSTDQRLAAIENARRFNVNTASDFIAQYTTRQEYRFVDGLAGRDDDWAPGGNGLRMPWDKPAASNIDRSLDEARVQLADLETRALKRRDVAAHELRDALRKAAALLCRVQRDQCAIVQHLVGIPFAVFTKQSVKLGISLWMSVIKENPRMEARVLVLVADSFEATVRRRAGLFDPTFRQPDPFYQKQEFAPSDRQLLERSQARAHDLITPHFRLLQFLSSHFSASRLGSPDVERVYTRLAHTILDALARGDASDHPLAREAHFHAVLLGLRILQHSTCLSGPARWRLKDRALSAAFTWFARPPYYSFGGNRLQIKAEAHILHDVMDALASPEVAGIGAKPDATGTLKNLGPRVELLLQLLQNEQTKLLVWLFPLEQATKHHFAGGRHQHKKMNSDIELDRCVATAWAESPALAVHLIPRLRHQRIRDQVRWKVLNHPQVVLGVPDALEVLMGARMPLDVTFQLKYLLFWSPVNPMTAVTYFMPTYGNHPSVVQYAMRALESHSVDITFFYVPQIVQLLRHDVLGYVERYIIETAKFSQLFAHQIIWNMKANAFKDEEAQVPDAIKPALDKVMEALIASFGAEDRAFYGREFSFFNEVTGISGKLKPFIKKSKPEKKQKIEEELRQIKVEVGVYLPSNPDGVVVGIDRKSGKPLQSHAKAPYMATFRIRRDRVDDDADAGGASGVAQRSFAEIAASPAPNSYEVWQSAIFKVGDDCRQDVLALQLIACFRNIFASVGLDVYVFPYRVTATAPGCGVIDVLPNTISRDMLGREAVNGLLEYFLSRYGSAESPAFQAARTNFVKSMAAYSVISYLLQFKDRHNGNIMLDDAGHIVHIDFGFCFDIAPGGIKFERAPFKLTAEMIAVMGGVAHHHSISPAADSTPAAATAAAGGDAASAGAGEAHAYARFEALCVRAFLASRPHAEHLAHLVSAMLESGLPCFRPETMDNFRARFAPGKDEAGAAEVMRGLVRRSAGSLTTRQYDQFQLLTNGIPY